MRTSLRLFQARLHYEPDIQVFTAISGPTPHLLAQYLALECSDGLRGFSEVRANITFLSHLPEEAVAPAIRRLAEALDWGSEPERLLDRLDELRAGHPPIALAALESALVDAIAVRDGISIAEVLEGRRADRFETNQCLFWSGEETFERLARRYLAEGFRKLKVRIGVGDFGTDLQRLRRLRDLGGPGIEIAVDANGSWTGEEAARRLEALQPIGIAYVEQPTRIGDWEALAIAGGAGAVPIMLDEGLRGDDDVARLIDLGPPFLAHLKIVKLGGPRVVARLARRLQAAGIGVMIGQMNEGGAATALAACCAMAVQPRHAELYGAYGLVDDAAPNVRYRAGEVLLDRVADLGAAFDPARHQPIWELRR